MNAETQAKIDGLWKLIANLEQQEQGASMTLEKSEQINFDKAAAHTEIKRLEAEDQAAELQKKVEDESIAFNVPGVDMTNLPHEMIQLGEIIVKFDRKRIYAEVKEKADKLAETTREAFESMAEQRKLDQSNLLKVNEELLFVNSNYRDLQINFDIAKAELNQARIENDDYKERLRNAATILDEKDEEIKRLNDLVFEYQQAKVNGEKEKHIIDVPADSLTEVQGLIDAIAKKYVKSEPIGVGNYHEVTAEDGTKTVVHKTEIPFIESQQENPFQPHEAATSNDGNVQNMATSEAAPVEAPTFQTIQAPPLGNIGLPMAPSTPGDSGESGETLATQGWVKEQLARALAEIRGAA